jgi:hypothetical protein
MGLILTYDILPLLTTRGAFVMMVVGEGIMPTGGYLIASFVARETGVTNCGSS